MESYLTSRMTQQKGSAQRNLLHDHKVWNYLLVVLRRTEVSRWDCNTWVTNRPTPGGLLIINFQFISVCLLLEFGPPHICPSTFLRYQVSPQTGLLKLKEVYTAADAEPQLSATAICERLQACNVDAELMVTCLTRWMGKTFEHIRNKECRLLWCDADWLL
jgi:hypothetical protein